MASPPHRAEAISVASHLTHQQHIPFVDPLKSGTLQLSSAEIWAVQDCRLPLRAASHGHSAVLSAQLMCTECQRKGTLNRLFWTGIITRLDFSLEKLYRGSHCLAELLNTLQTLTQQGGNHLVTVS